MDIIHPGLDWNPPRIQVRPSYANTRLDIISVVQAPRSIPHSNSHLDSSKNILNGSYGAQKKTRTEKQGPCHQELQNFNDGLTRGARDVLGESTGYIKDNKI